LRVCVPEIFPAYFRLSLPAGTVTRADVDALLAATQDPAAFANVLRDALAQKTARGTSKARALLERLMDHVPDDLGSADAEPVIKALLDMGDELLVRTDKVAGDFDFGNQSRVSRVAYHLLKKVDAANRCEVVASAISNGRAIRCGQYLIGALADEVDKEAKGERGQALVRVEDVDRMKSAWLSRAEVLASEPSFIDHPALARLLSVWRHWGDESNVKAWWAQASGTDEGLAKLIAAFQSESTSHGFGDHAVRVHMHVNPKGIEPYDDVHALAARAQILVDAGKVPEAHAAAVKRFIVECERIKDGKNPEDFDFDDD
jgi:predicted KAP-like P-loop ATPase